MALNWTIHPDAASMAAALAGALAKALTARLCMPGRAALALAGGRTAPPVCRALAARPLPWSRVSVLPTDERWVAESHADSNLRVLRECFAAAPAELRALVPDAPGPTPSADAANAALADLPRFAAVLLGMGADGHFASLFPGDPGLGPHPRISLTLARLLDSDRLLLAISGADKRAVVEQALAEPARFPVGALLTQTLCPVEIHWSP
ncbi:MAG: 6-phosphogluconolactonase [Xanthomonadales bacterium]|nr:6-phosphogluconolactonase [Xanthomonadales bacterium]